MLDSYQIAEALLARGFEGISSSTRTKAHGYKHPALTYPVYVKIGGRAGSLYPIDEAPLVIHPEDAMKLESRGGMPEGVRLEAGPYKSAGLLKFRAGAGGGTPWGRDLSVSNPAALDVLISVLGVMGPITAQSAAVAESVGDEAGEEPQLPDTFEARAAAACVDEDPQCRNESPTTRLALINARLGQGGYRRRMLALWDGTCAVTGCAVLAVLVASHATPWVKASNRERLDEFNGLLLAASLDRLFDQGLISFSDDGQMLRKPDLSDAELQVLGLDAHARLRAVHPRHLPYLAAHRAAFGF